MAALTTADHFGTNAVLDTGAGTLTITLSDLAGAGLDIAAPTAAQVFAALVLHLYGNMPADPTLDPDIGVVVADPFKSFTTRGTEDQISYQYGVSLYVPDTTTTPDPDNVVV